MDAAVTRTAKHNVPLSPVLGLIMFFLPRDSTYLLYVYIDDNVPRTERKELYRLLGREIRSQARRWPYSNYRGLVGGYSHIHSDCYLHSDLIYLEGLPAVIREAALLQEDINVLTGIMHTGWLTSKLNYVDWWTKNETAYLKEVPWDAIRWDDVLDYSPDGYINESVYDSVETMIANPELHLSYTRSVRTIEEAHVLEASLINTIDHHIVASGRVIRQLLAGRASNVERPLHWDIRVTTKVVDGRWVILVPNPPLMIDRLDNHHIYQEAHRDEYPSGVLRNTLLLYDHVNRGKKTLKTLTEDLFMCLSYILYVIGNGSIYPKVLDPSDYRSYCQLISETLGSNVLHELTIELLEPITEDTVEELEGRRVDESEIDALNLRKEAFATAAVEVIETSTTPHFTSWPPAG